MAEHLLDGLGECVECGGGGDSLTTDCPEFMIDTNDLDLIYDGRIDYVNGNWVDLTYHF